MSKCPLSNPSLGIVTTNAHYVGSCLCHYCTCGKHLCPRMNIKDPFPRGTFTTKYMSEHNPNGFDKPVKPEPRLYRPNKHPMDLLTSNQDDFKGVQTKTAVPIMPVDQKSPKKPELNATTMNNYNYPDWGPRKVNHEKRFHPPVRTVEIPFNGKSSYSRNYSSISPKECKVFHTDYSESTAFQSTFSLGPRSKLDDRTTYSEKMRNYSGSNFNTRIQVRAAKAEVIKTTPSHYSTTMNSFYQSPHQQIDPRLMKYTLQSSGLKKLLNN